MKYLFILYAIVLASCKSPNEKDSDVKTIGLEQLEASIDSLFNAEIGENEPGAAILISYRGEKLINKGFGLADVKNKEPITPKTNMRTGSVGKQFTALSILSLVDKGLLSLNDSLNKFWPYDVFKNITVEQLINHTSGLAHFEPYFKQNWNQDSIVGNKDILDWLSTNPTPSFKAGTNFEYNNTGYIVLALLVEKASGIEFSSYAQKHVFEKAGMESTRYYSLLNPVEIDNRAHCYEKDSLGIWNNVDGYYMDGIMGSMGVYTNITDFLTYDNALQNQTIVSKEMHELIFKSTTEPLPEKESYHFDFLNGEEQGYGMGWFVTNKLALHGGSWKGARAMAVKELKRPLTIVIFINNNSSELRNRLIESTHLLADEYIKIADHKEDDELPRN